MNPTKNNTSQVSEGPDFVGVGMQKCGTTWLADALVQHPGVMMDQKQLDFFVRYFYKGYKWYNSWFKDRNGRKAGEYTPNYIISPRPESFRKEFYPSWNPRRIICFWQKQASARDELKAHYPGVKVLAIFRNPIERAWSSYWSRLNRKARIGKSYVPFQKMWDDDGRWIRTCGFYSKHLSHWREVFPDMGVYFYDDILNDPAGLLRDVYRYIGVDDTFVPDVSRKIHTGNYDAIPLETKEMLIDFYRDEISNFSAMTGRDLSHWLK